MSGGLYQTVTKKLKLWDSHISKLEYITVHGRNCFNSEDLNCEFELRIWSEQV